MAENAVEPLQPLHLLDIAAAAEAAARAAQHHRAYAVALRPDRLEPRGQRLQEPEVEGVDRGPVDDEFQDVPRVPRFGQHRSPSLAAHARAPALYALTTRR